MENNTKQKLKPLQHLWPAALTGMLIACAASAMKPTLASVPELLEYTEAETNTTTNKPKLKDAAVLAKQSSKKKTKEKSSSDAFADQDSYKDGTYTGSAQGFGGPIEVQVTVTGGKISAVSILSASGETEPYFSQARSVINTIISTGSPNVDAVSGATYSSNGILNAVKRALGNAGGAATTLDIVELTPAAVDTTPPVLAPVTIDPSSITAKPANALKDGTYTGSAYGFGGNITVRVTIAGGKITGINVLSASGETGSFFNRAQSMIPGILASQTADVDSVSGATYSSNGIKNAVRAALAKAVSNQVPGNSNTSDSSTGGNGQNTLKPVTPGSDNDSQEIMNNPDLQKKDPDKISKKPEKDLKDGIYKGTGEGFGGDIELEITVKEGKIVQIEIISAEDETPTYFNKAKAILSDILDHQSNEVDTVSGATYSSEGILEALSEAMNEAEENAEKEDNPDDKGDQETDPDNKDEETDKKEEESVKPDEDDLPVYLYKNGTYIAEVLCSDDETAPENSTFWYTVNMSITIENDLISEISVLRTADQSEDPDANETYFNYAINGRTRKGVFYPGVISQLLEGQSADELDAVSSATYTSNALIKAAREVFAAAKQVEEQP